MKPVRLMRISRFSKRGFTLVEVIVSMAILAVVSIGFTVAITGNTRVLSRGYRMDQYGYANGRLIEDQGGSKTGRLGVLTFRDETNGLSGMFSLYEYKAKSSNIEKYEMYYFREQ